MNIGIDIDNVISKFDENLLQEYLKHDKTLRNTGIVNPDAPYIRIGMFDWTREEEKSFYYGNIDEIASNFEIVENADKYIKLLKEKGNKIFIISGRDNGEYSDPYNMTIKWLDKNNIVYDELILTDAFKHHEKAEVCLEKQVDIMIDDSLNVCKECSNSGVKTLLFDSEYNRKIQTFQRVNSWEEIYEFINTYKKDNAEIVIDNNEYSW